MNTILPELEKVLAPLPAETRQVVMLEVENGFTSPPILRTTQQGEAGGFTYDGFANSSFGMYTQTLDMGKIEQMMRSGQIAYPMAVKKAPAISIVNSESGFQVNSPDENLARIMHSNMRELLPRTIDEILTYQEYGAYYSEVVWEPTYPQDYGLTKSPIPYWCVADMHAVHPTTVNKILRDERNRSFQGFVQQVSWRPEPVTIGLDRALIISNQGTFGNLEGRSVLEAVYVWWFWYELVWRALLRYLQRVGDGVVIVRAPSRGKVFVNGRAVDAIDWAMQVAASLRKTNQGVIPSDTFRETNTPLWNVELVKTGDEQAGRHFTDALEMLSKNIVRFLLTGDAEGKDGGEFTIMLDTERMLSQIATHMNRYVMRKALKYNGSRAAKLWLEFQGANSRILPLLFKLMAVAGNSAGDALQNVNWRDLFTKGGVPVLNEDEVEELRQAQAQKEKDLIEAKSSAQQSKFGQPPKKEDAKGQRGGEGRWASQRDKEGKPEKLEELAWEMKTAIEMVGQATSIPVVALGEDQVEQLKELGLYDDGQPIVLFNPWHDKVGRFTGKQHAVSPGAAGYDAARRVEREYSRVELVGNFTDAERSTIEGLVRSAPIVPGAEHVPIKWFDSWNGMRDYAIEQIRSGRLDGDVSAKEEWFRQNGPGNILGIYMSGTTYRDSIVCTSINALKSSEVDGGRSIINTIVHEQFHARPRLNGDVDHGINLPNKGYLIMEEGSTGLLADRLTGESSGWAFDGAYGRYKGAISMLAYMYCNGNWDCAWKFVDQLQLHMNDSQFIFETFAKITGTSAADWDENSVYAYIQSMMATCEADGYWSLAWLNNQPPYHDPSRKDMPVYVEPWKR